MVVSLLSSWWWRCRRCGDGVAVVVVSSWFVVVVVVVDDYCGCVLSKPLEIADCRTRRDSPLCFVIDSFSRSILSQLFGKPRAYTASDGSPWAEVYVRVVQG